MKGILQNQTEPSKILVKYAKSTKLFVPSQNINFCPYSTSAISLFCLIVGGGWGEEWTKQKRAGKPTPHNTKRKVSVQACDPERAT